MTEGVVKHEHEHEDVPPSTGGHDDEHGTEAAAADGPVKHEPETPVPAPPADPEGAAGEAAAPSEPAGGTTRASPGVQSPPSTSGHRDAHDFGGATGAANGRRPVPTPAPSKVIHFRNLGHGVTEEDLREVAGRFGQVDRVVLMRSRRQCMVQFMDIPPAVALMNAADSGASLSTPSGSRLYPNFSMHAELNSTEEQARSRDDARMRERDRDRDGRDRRGGGRDRDYGDRDRDRYDRYDRGGGRDGPPPRSRAPGEPHYILLTTIHNMQYPITVDTLVAVFGKYGPIHKIVIFNKPGRSTQAFIQYHTVEPAVAAYKELDGRNIYDNCCTLQIGYSTNDTLNVTANNDRTRDFTDPTLPTESPSTRGATAGMAAGGQPGQMYGAPPGAMAGGPMMVATSQMMTGQPQMMGQGGPMMMGGQPQMMGGQPMMMGGQPSMMMGGQPQMMGAMMGAPMGGMMMQPPVSMPPPQQASMYGGGAPQGGGGGDYDHDYERRGRDDRRDGRTPCLLFSKLRADKVTADALFNLCSGYGNVRMIKILRTKPDHALVEMSDSDAAAACLRGLDRMVLFGQTIDVNPSKHERIENSVDATEYTNHPGNRFFRGSTRNRSNTCAPSTMLHLAGLSSDTQERDIRHAFAEFGKITALKVFQVSGRHMGLVQFSSQGCAADALAAMHHQTLNGSTIKVSFSNNTLSAADAVN